MSNVYQKEVLGIIRGGRWTFARHMVFEDLFFTPDRVFVARVATGAPWYAPTEIDIAKSLYNVSYKLKKSEKGYLELPLGDVLKADKNNYAISNSEIIKVELKKFGRGSFINITTNKKTQKWFTLGLIPEKKDVKLEDYENILRQAFPDKLVS